MGLKGAAIVDVNCRIGRVVEHLTCVLEDVDWRFDLGSTLEFLKVPLQVLFLRLLASF